MLNDKKNYIRYFDETNQTLVWKIFTSNLHFYDNIGNLNCLTVYLYVQDYHNNSDEWQKMKCA